MTKYALSNIHTNIRLWMFIEHEFPHEQFCAVHQFICLSDTEKDPLIYGFLSHAPVSVLPSRRELLWDILGVILCSDCVIDVQIGNGQRPAWLVTLKLKACQLKTLSV